MILIELTLLYLSTVSSVLLWVFVWFAVRSLRRDIEIFSPKKSRSFKNKYRRKPSNSSSENNQNNIVSRNEESNKLSENPTLYLLLLMVLWLDHPSLLNHLV